MVKATLATPGDNWMFGAVSNIWLNSHAGATYATARPRAPPAAAGTTLSTSSCLTSRARVPPSDSRVPISCCRSTARASSRLPTLPQATSSTISIAACRRPNTSDALSQNPGCESSAVSVSAMPWASSPCCRANVAETASSCAAARPVVTPGRSRPNTEEQHQAGATSSGPTDWSSGRSSCSEANGTHAAASLSLVPPKPGGATPTIVNGTLSSRTRVPTIPSSAPNRRCHVRWLMTTTACGDEGTSSSARKPRPRAMSTFSTRKKLPVTSCAGEAGASSPSANCSDSSRVAATPSSSVASASSERTCASDAPIAAAPRGRSGGEV